MPIHGTKALNNTFTVKCYHEITQSCKSSDTPIKTANAQKRKAVWMPYLD